MWSKINRYKFFFLQCPRQINGVDCGYFVMRFMKEVIMENEFMIPTNVRDFNYYYYSFVN